MSTPVDRDRSRISVIGVSGEFLGWATEDEAHLLVRHGQATVVRRRGKIRVVQAVVESIRKPWEVRMLGRGSALDHTRYSHRRETEENPPRVWAFTRVQNLSHGEA